MRERDSVNPSERANRIITHTHTHIIEYGSAAVTVNKLSVKKCP
jgi:hypothetical protein